MKLYTITVINNKTEPGAFYGLSCLQTLELQSNNLSSIPEDCIMNCSNLKNLNLRSNKLIRAPRLTGCTEITELLLDMNKLTTLEDFMDDLGVDVWSTVNRLGISGNKITNWSDVKHLAGFENLETLDLSGNPFCSHLNIDIRLFCLWLCPMLSLIDGKQTTIDDINAASSLFVDQGGGTCNEALLIDTGPPESTELHEYLLERIPLMVPVVAEVQPQQQQQQQPTPPAATHKDLPAMKQKVKEMSQVIRILHRAHMNKRYLAATTIIVWFRARMQQRHLPPEMLMRLKNMSIWGWPKGCTKKQQTGLSWVDKVIAHSKTVNIRQQMKLLFPFTVVPASAPQPCRRKNTASRAATIIQKYCRRYLVHTRFQERNLFLYCALTIQAVWRGHKTRVVLKKNRNQNLINMIPRLMRGVDDLLRENIRMKTAINCLRVSAAKKIQSFYRGHRARVRYAKIKMRYDEHCRRYFKHINMLQKGIRAYKARLEVGKLFQEHRKQLQRERVSREREERIERERISDRNEIKNLKNQVEQLFEIVRVLQAGNSMPIVENSQQRLASPEMESSPQNQNSVPSAPSAPSAYNNYDFEYENDDEEDFDEESLSEAADDNVDVYPVRSTGLRFIGTSSATGTRYPATSNSVTSLTDDILPLSHHVPYSSSYQTTQQDPLPVDPPEPETSDQFVDHVPETAPPSYSVPSLPRNSNDFRFNDLITPARSDTSL